jgi:hypothetical protein
MTSVKGSKDADNSQTHSSRQLLGDHASQKNSPTDDGLTPSIALDNLQSLPPDAALAAFRAHQARLRANSSATSGSGPPQLSTLRLPNTSGTTVHRIPEPHPGLPPTTPYPPTASSQSAYAYGSNNDPQSQPRAAYTSKSELSLPSSVVPPASGAFPPPLQPNYPNVQQTFSPSSGVRLFDPTPTPYAKSLTTDVVSPTTSTQAESGSDTKGPLQPLRYVEGETPAEQLAIDPQPVSRWKKSFRRK